MARVLVTGADGFIGQALVRSLSESGHRVVQMHRSHGDVADAVTWNELPAADHVVHLAGRSYVPDSWHHPASFIQTNVGGTTRALDYCRDHGAHLVFVSAYVYGIPKRLPVGEDDPIEPNNPYALSKVIAEQVCRFYADAMNVPVTVIRPFNIFGAGQRRIFLLPTIIEQVIAGGDIRVRDLTPARDYLFIDDFIQALTKALAVPGENRFRVINIGSGVSYSVRDIINIVQAAAGTQLPVISETEPRVNEIQDSRADISRARAMLEWKPSLTLAQGIERILRTGLTSPSRSDCI